MKLATLNLFLLLWCHYGRQGGRYILHKEGEGRSWLVHCLLGVDLEYTIWFHERFSKFFSSDVGCSASLDRCYRWAGGLRHLWFSILGVYRFWIVLNLKILTRIHDGLAIVLLRGIAIAIFKGRATKGWSATRRHIIYSLEHVLLCSTFLNGTLLSTVRLLIFVAPVHELGLRWG